jgi:O-antigen/teichoic acid export membrane protein
MNQVNKWASLFPEHKLMKKESVITNEASATTKNISVIVLLKAAQIPFLALFVMLVPRMMGPEIYGQYAVLISIIMIAATVICFGFTGEIFGRFVPEFEIRGESGNIRRISSNVLALKCAIAPIISVVLFSILYFVYGDRYPITYFLFIVATVLVVDWGSVPYALLYGLNKLGKFASRDLIRRALSLTLILILFHYYGLFGAIMSNLLVEASFTMLTLFWTREYFRIKDFGIDLSFLKPYLRFGFVFYLSWGLLVVWQRLGNPLIDYMTHDSREVALFDIPNHIFLITAAFFFFVINSFVPIFTKLLLTGKEEKLIRWSMISMKYTGIICMVILWAFILVGPDLIPIIIGSEYRNIFPNGVVLLLGIFPMCLAQLGIVLATVYKQPIKYFQALCFAFFTFLVASILLIPQYASMGCSIATFISCMVLAVVMCFHFREKIVPYLADGVKTMALGFAFVPFLFFRGSLITNLFLVVCSVATYALLLFAGRVLNLGEIREIIQAIRHQPEELSPQ